MTDTLHGQTIERRQLTILFCDIEGSTALSALLDPEDLRELIVAYRLCVSEVIRRFDGYIAQHMGDGTLAYFGYPTAHETDAERAIYAALELNSAVSALPTGHKIRVRVGISTGVVVVGDFSEGADLGHHYAFGEAPNVAARLQGIASPGRVAVSDLTKRIAGPLFHFHSLGEFTFKGIDRGIGVWEVIAPASTASRSHALAYRGLPPIIGREPEMALLADTWLRANNGEGSAILLRGDAGIGKSRLVLGFLEHLQSEQMSLLSYYCSSQHADDAYFPLRAELERAARIQMHDSQDGRAAKLGDFLVGLPGMTPDRAALLIALVCSAPQGDTSSHMSPRERRRALLHALLSRIELLAAQRPLVVVVEDAQWMDPTSNEVLENLVERAHALRILVLVTARPEYQPAWCAAPGMAVHELGPLNEAALAAIITRIAQNSVLPQALVARIVGRSDGVPLFAEELTKAALAIGDVPEEDLAASTSAVPATLRASLVARLDRVPVAKHLAGIGATIGRDFSYELLAAASDWGVDELASGIDQLVASGLVEQHGEIPDARFTFKHALLQDAAYGTLLRRRRYALHCRIGDILETRFNSVAAAQPHIVARHFTEGQQPQRAIGYWLDAARIASERYANPEAVSYVTRGLEGLRTTPNNTERARRELDFLAVLGPALIATVGNAADATLEAYERGRVLMQDVRESEHWDIILLGLGSGYWTRAEHRAVMEVADEFVREAERRGDAGPICVAHRLAAAAHMIVGEFAVGTEHGEKAFNSYDPVNHRHLISRYGTDAGIGAACQWAFGLWHMHRIAKASELFSFANAHAERIAHPNTTGYALYYGGAFPAFVRREFEALRDFTARLKEYATHHDLPHWFDHGLALEGPLLAQRGRPAEGIESARQGLALCEKSGHKSVRPVFLAGLAEACLIGGRFGDATQAIEAALSFSEQTNGRWMDPELWRLRGVLALATDGSASTPQAEHCFSRGLVVARQQRTRSLELRLATSLAELWSDRGLVSEAHDLLRSTRERFPAEDDGVATRCAHAVPGLAHFDRVT